MVFSNLPINLTNTSIPFQGVIDYYFNHTSEYSRYLRTTSSTNSDISYTTLNPSLSQVSWCTLMDQNDPQWYQVELRKGILYMTSYSLRSGGNVKGSHYNLLGWKILASIDGFHWDEIDTQETDTMDNFQAFDTFIPTTKGLYRFFRLIQTKLNSRSYYGFALREIELNGILFESNYVPFHRYINHIHHSISFPFVLLVTFFLF